MNPKDYYFEYVFPEEFGSSYFDNPNYFNESTDCYLVYEDHLGYLTVGPGVLIDASFKKKYGNDVRLGDEYTRSEVEDIALERWFDAVDGAADLCPDLDEEEILPLAEMVYQMGYNGVSKFHNTLRLYRNRQFREAAKNALKSKWARQTPHRAQVVTDRIWNLEA